MSDETKAREKMLRVRPEVARLRAVGGLSTRVVVDGASLLSWCARSGADYAATVSAIVDAASAGGREVVLVESPRARSSLRAPHVVFPSTTGVAGLLRTPAAGALELAAFPSVIVADVAHDRQLLDILEGGAINLLDIASGCLRHGNVGDQYDKAFAADAGNAAAQPASATGEAFVAAITTPRSPHQVGRTYVVAALHREGGRVVLDRVGVDDGVRRHADGHADGLTLLRNVIAQGIIPVMTTSMDVLDALYDARLALPARVEDPALACIVLDPDELALPPGIGASWRRVLAGRRGGDAAVHSHVDLLLDELPAVHAELRDALQAEGLLSLYEDDVCATAPLFAAIERGGFYVSTTGLAADLATVEAQMEKSRTIVLAGVGEKYLRNADLVRAPSQHVGQLIRQADGSLPRGWRHDDELLERFAVCGNARAVGVKRLRGLDAVAAWMKKLEGRDRLQSVLEPAATGRWYAHGEALSGIPKHGPEARVLREHLVPERGHMFVSGDFAAFEPRLLAHQSGDQTLIAACQGGGDFYSNLMPVLGVKSRDIVKKGVLALMYGTSPKSFAGQLPLSMPDGHGIYEQLEKLLKKALEFRADVHKSDTVSAQSLYGWRRRRGAQTHAEFARRAFNLRMQGTGADLLRKLLRDLLGALPPSARVVHQEFDAVIISCPAPDVHTVEVILKHAMENVAQLAVPLVAKTKHGGTLAAVS